MSTPPPHLPLAGKKALVTGGKRRIGRGICLALAEAGADVGLCDLERDADGEETMRLIRALGRERPSCTALSLCSLSPKGTTYIYVVYLP